MVNVRGVEGEMTKFNGDSGGVPRWVVESSKGVEGKGIKRVCKGAFCGAEFGGDKNVVWVSGGETVTGRSIIKARREMGMDVGARELGESNMNRTFNVCRSCKVKYGEMDRERARKARERLEEEVRREEEERKVGTGGKREKGWKSRLQVEFEKGLEAEKRKVQEFLDIKRKAKFEIEKKRAMGHNIHCCCAGSRRSEAVSV